MKATFAILALAAAQSHAAISITLPGNSESAAFTSLNNIKYLSSAGWRNFGGNLLSPLNGTTPALNVTADLGSTLSGEFNKVSGGGYFASSSIYNFDTPGTLRIFDSSAIASLATVIFQADLGSALAGAPTLNFNGGTQALVSDFQTTAPGGFTSGFGGPPAPTTNYAWQWDLRSLGATSYEINFGTIAHGTIFRLDLAAGDTFAQVIPEPSSLILSAFGTFFLTRRRRA